MKSYYDLENKEKKELKKIFKKTLGERNIYLFYILFWFAFIALNIFDILTFEMSTFKTHLSDKTYLLFFVPATVLSIYYNFAFRQYIKTKNNIH